MAKKPIAVRSAQALSRPTANFVALSGEATILTIAVSLTCILSGALRLARWRPGPQVMTSLTANCQFIQTQRPLPGPRCYYLQLIPHGADSGEFQSEYVRKHLCQHALRDFLLGDTAGLQREHARSATIAAQPIE